MHDRQRIDRDRPLIKIYKDLMVTKRDLIDLRESITNTIQSIKHSDDAIRKIRQRRCQNCGDMIQKSEGHQCKQMECGMCSRKILGIFTLNQHRKLNHHICPKCLKTYSEPLDQHERHSCPESALPCQSCQLQVKKKDLDKHFKVCGFRQCSKCRQDIYFKAYAYHLQSCGKNANKNLIVPCKKLPSRVESRPVVWPCCLVVEGYA